MTASLRTASLRHLVAGLTLLFLVSPVAGAEDTLLIRDVRIFNGVDAELTPGHVLVEGDKIAKISSDPIEAPDGARVIDGAGRVLSPGFIDLHVHLTLAMPANQMRVHPWVVGRDGGRRRQVLPAPRLHHGARRRRHPPRPGARRRSGCWSGRASSRRAPSSRRPAATATSAAATPHPTLCGLRASHVRLTASVIADGVPQTLAAVRENLRTAPRRSRSWAAAASPRTTTRSTRCSRRPRRSAPRCRRRATGAPT